MSDEYKTISEHKTGEGRYSEKRSKFLAFAHHVSSAAEVKVILEQYHRRYYDARHICYAYRLGPEGTEYRANDDGEPSSTGGKPILGQIDSRGLTDVLVLVVRYYGGINLGTGPLAVAYRTAASAAIDDSSIETRTIEETVSLSFPYERLNDVRRIIKDTGARVLDRQFADTCAVTLAIPRGNMERYKRWALENGLV